MQRSRGFTLIELLVVLAIVALMLSVALPRYMASMDKARDVALADTLRTVRIGLDKFKADRGKWPQSIDELVTSKYLAASPIDPITSSPTTWNVVTSTDEASLGVSDLKSGAPGTDREGKPYASY